MAQVFCGSRPFCHPTNTIKPLKQIISDDVSFMLNFLLLCAVHSCFSSSNLNSSWVELNASRGHESYSHKVFMRDSGEFSHSFWSADDCNLCLKLHVIVIASDHFSFPSVCCCKGL